MAGNPTYIVTKPVGSATYSATRFEYAKNGQAVTYVLGETWLPDGSDPDTLPDDYDITFAREFRYDGGRMIVAYSAGVSPPANHCPTT